MARDGLFEQLFKAKIFGNIKCIDLFCGVGGLTYGLQEEGLEVVAGFDIDLAANIHSSTITLLNLSYKMSVRSGQRR